jgi:hypothetical protein
VKELKYHTQKENSKSNASRSKSYFGDFADSSSTCVATPTASHSRYKVLIVERFGFPGGRSTKMLDTFFQKIFIDNPHRIFAFMS